MIRLKPIPPEKRGTVCKGCGRMHVVARLTCTNPGIFDRAWELCANCLAELRERVRAA